MPRPRIAEFLRFCAVGLLGFMVDSGTLELLVYAGVAVPIARGFSMTLALLVAYILHLRFTYRGHAQMSGASFSKFMLSNLMGVAVNYALFMAVLAMHPSTDAQISRLIALVTGTAVAMGFNYWANRRFVFARKRPS